MVKYGKQFICNRCGKEKFAQGGRICLLVGLGYITIMNYAQFVQIYTTI